MMTCVANKATPVTYDIQQAVINLYGTQKAKDLASMLGITIHQVYHIANKFSLTNKINQKFKIEGIQEQIILSGILGDGRLKKNGRYNYYYSECHALDEKEYCEWKYNILSNGLTNGMNMYGKNLNNEHGDAIEFCTKTTPSLITYANMTFEDIIQKLDHNGLLLYILDDGWFSKHSKNGNFAICGGMLNSSQLEMVCNQFAKYGIIDCHITGRSSLDITIPSSNNKTLYDIAYKLIGSNIDVFRKKFSYIVNTNQHL